MLSKIRVDKGFHAEKFRDLHFDVLIALSASSVGARLVTSDGADFEMIASYSRVQPEIW
jgi:predicted nucleic acid-binding protein